MVEKIFEKPNNRRKNCIDQWENINPKPENRIDI